MQSKIMTVEDLLDVCNKAPKDASVFVYVLSSYVGYDGWHPVSGIEGRFDDGEEVFVHFDEKDAIKVGDVLKNDFLSSMDKDAPMKVFVEYSWSSGKYAPLREIWYEAADNSVYLGPGSNM